MSSGRSKFSPVRCRIAYVTSLQAPKRMWVTVAVGCRVVFTTTVGGRQFDLPRRRGNSERFWQPSRSLGTSFVGMLG